MKWLKPALERGISFETLRPARAAQVVALARTVDAATALRSSSELRAELVRAEQSGSPLSFALCEGRRVRGYVLAFARPQGLRGEPGPVVQIVDLALDPEYRSLLGEFVARWCDQLARSGAPLPLEAIGGARELRRWSARCASLWADLGYRLAAQQRLAASDVQQRDVQQGDVPQGAAVECWWMRWQPVPANPDPLGLPVLESHALGGERIDVRAVRSERHWARLQPYWNALAERTPGAAGYHSYEYLRAWWRCFGPSRRLWILTFWRGSELLGIAPLCASVRRSALGAVRELLFLGAPYPVDRPLFLFGEQAAPCVEVLLRVLAGSHAPWEVLQLHEQLPGAPSTAALLERAGQLGWLCRMQPDTQSAHAPLSGSFEQFMAARAGTFRQKLRAAGRRLEAVGRVHCERIGEWPALRDALERYRALEQRSWKRDAPGAVGSRVRRPLYEALFEALGPKGGLSVAFLLVDGRPAAAAIGLAHGHCYHGLETVYDEEFARCSPGLLLQSLEIEHAFALGCSEFDLRGGDLGYKRNWTANTLETQRVCLAKPVFALRLEHLQRVWLRPWLKQLLARTGLLERALALQQARFERVRRRSAPPLPEAQPPAADLSRPRPAGAARG